MWYMKVKYDKVSIFGDLILEKVEEHPGEKVPVSDFVLERR